MTGQVRAPRNGTAGSGSGAPVAGWPARAGALRTGTRGPTPRGVARLRHLRRQGRRLLASRGDVLLVIAAGGALGSLARWSLSEALPVTGGAFPWATIDANVSGCFLLGALMVLLTDGRPPSRYARAFLGVGVLGGYTTFSTAMLDTRSLLLSGQAQAAGAYLAGSVLAGLAAVWAGIVAVRVLLSIARRVRGARYTGIARSAATTTRRQR
jgi:fluoride exporter